MILLLKRKENVKSLLWQGKAELVCHSLLVYSLVWLIHPLEHIYFIKGPRFLKVPEVP